MQKINSYLRLCCYQRITYPRKFTCFDNLGFLVRQWLCSFFQTYKQPITDYITVREKAANQKRDVEKALCKFIAKTGSTMQLVMEGDEQNITVPG